MRTDLFDFALPPERIAQFPARPRDAARLLVVGETLADRGVLDLPEMLRPDDVLVFNDTRVLPVRFSAKRGEARVELTLHEMVDERTWRAFARPARKCRVGDTLRVAEGFAAAVLARGEAGEATLGFDVAGEDLLAAFRAHGRMPLPPYIRHGDAEEADVGDYQTRFARRDGAVASPTAALHFTDGLMAALAARGIAHEMLTLHVGAGTYLPVKADDTRDHAMHAERYVLDEAVAERLNAARSAGRRLVAVGTTALRTLETCAGEDGVLRAGSGATRLFITPGYRFRAVDLLMTNFHLPRSTLFMLVCAFAGTARMRAAYAHAIDSGYRFYSYGDACLLSPAWADDA